MALRLCRCGVISLFGLVLSIFWVFCSIYTVQLVTKTIKKIKIKKAYLY